MIQAKVPRDQLAALLLSADHCALGTMRNVADRLGLGIRTEVPEQHEPLWRTTANPSVVDLARRRLGGQ